MLVEILVSALILTIASAAVVTVMSASVGTAGEQRHGTEAYALAQQDQARLATMRLSNLNHLEETRQVTLSGATFDVHSDGLWIENQSSTQVCSASSSSDYVQITSEVTWPGMNAAEKAKIVSILAPSGPQSVDPSLKGRVLIKVSNEKGQPIAGVVLKGTQISGVGGSFLGKSDASGCASFPELPMKSASGSGDAPNYSVVADGTEAGVINKDGKSTESSSGAASATAPEIVSFRFDHPGTLPINFKYRVGSGSEFKPATADSLVVFQTGLTGGIKTFWTTSGLREPTVSAANLFPFNSPYSVWAGSCEGNKPGAGAEAAMASVVVPAGASAPPATIQLPALELKVRNGAVPITGAKVTVTDTKCKDSKGAAVKRVYTTNKDGNQTATAEGPAEPGLPYGTYEVCASAEVQPKESRKVSVGSVVVQSLTSAKVLEIDLSNGTSGVCL